MFVGVANVDREAEVTVHQSNETVDQISHVLERPRLLPITVDLAKQPSYSHTTLKSKLYYADFHRNFPVGKVVDTNGDKS